MATLNVPSHVLSSRLAPPLRLFLVLLVALTTACILVEAFCSLHLHLGTPYNWPLMPSADPFRDFYLYRPRYRFFHTDLFFPFPGADYMYPAPVASLYRFFYLFPHSTIVFLSGLCLAVLGALTLFARALLRRHLAPLALVQLFLVLLLCSYPFAFEFEQANMEWLIWLLVAGGIWAFLTGRGNLAGVCFGLVGALKLYPFLFAGLFLPRRQYRQFALALVVFALATLAGLWLVDPNLAASWAGTQQGIARFRFLYMLHYQDLRFDHSLFALIKFLATLRGGGLTITHLQQGLALYMPFVALAGFAAWLLRIRRLPVLNQVLCLTVAMILLPPVSYDYTLLHLYTPWALLVLFTLETRDRLTPGLTGVFCCFAILLAPETEFVWHGQSFGGQVKGVTLVTLLILALHHRFPSSFDRNLANSPTIA